MTSTPINTCSINEPDFELIGLLHRQAQAFDVPPTQLASALVGLIIQQNAMDKNLVYPCDRSFTNLGAPDYLQKVGIFSDLEPEVFASLRRVTNTTASEEQISDAALHFCCLDMIQLKIAAHSMREAIDQVKEAGMSGARSIGKSNDLRLSLVEKTLRACLREDPSDMKLPELTLIAVELATTQPVTDHNVNDAREAIGSAPQRTPAPASGGSHAPRKRLLRCYDN